MLGRMFGKGGAEPRARGRPAHSREGQPNSEVIVAVSKASGRVTDQAVEVARDGTEVLMNRGLVTPPASAKRPRKDAPETPEAETTAAKKGRRARQNWSSLEDDLLALGVLECSATGKVSKEDVGKVIRTYGAQALNAMGRDKQSLKTRLFSAGFAKHLEQNSKRLATPEGQAELLNALTGFEFKNQNSPGKAGSAKSVTPRGKGTRKLVELAEVLPSDSEDVEGVEMVQAETSTKAKKKRATATASGAGRLLRVEVSGQDSPADPGVASAIAGLMHKCGGDVREMTVDRLGGGFVCVCLLHPRGSGEKLGKAVTAALTDAAGQRDRSRPGPSSAPRDAGQVLQGCTFKAEWTESADAVLSRYRLNFAFPDSGSKALAEVLKKIQAAGIRIPSVRTKWTETRGGTCTVDATLEIAAEDEADLAAAILRALSKFGANVLTFQRN